MLLVSYTIYKIVFFYPVGLGNRLGFYPMLFVSDTIYNIVFLYPVGLGNRLGFYSDALCIVYNI